MTENRSRAAEAPQQKIVEAAAGLIYPVPGRKRTPLLA
jgi:hypothetical protein